jgi:hypothetical protein
MGSIMEADLKKLFGIYKLFKISVIGQQEMQNGWDYLIILKQNNIVMLIMQILNGVFTRLKLF